VAYQLLGSELGFHGRGCYDFHAEPNKPYPMIDIYRVFGFLTITIIIIKQPIVVVWCCMCWVVVGVCFWWGCCIYWVVYAGLWCCMFWVVVGVCFR